MKKNTNEVVVYTAVDEVFSERILNDFEKETGIKVKAVYDTEANKTTGLVNRIIAEKDNPICDVFWNNEFVQTIDLERKGLLSEYVSKSAEDISDDAKEAIKDGANVTMIYPDQGEDGMEDLFSVAN